MVEKFFNLGKNTNIKIQEGKRVPNKRNPKRPTPRHIITMANIKDNFKGSKKIKDHRKVNAHKTIS